MSAAEQATAAAPHSTGLLAGVHAVFFDLDGCLWFGDALADGAAELVRDLRAVGRTVRFVTNISSARATDIAGKLARLGIPAEPRDVLVPLEALRHHPRLQARPIAFVVGSERVAEAVAEATPVTDDPERADLVVVTRDRDLTYGTLAAALQPLLRGAPLLALNADLRVPVDHGRVVPGAGAVAAALEAAAGVRADVVGKPSRHFFDTALRRFGATAATTIMVGDNLDSDVAGGRAAGIRTVHVGGNDFSTHQPPPTPDRAVADLHALRATLWGEPPGV